MGDVDVRVHIYTATVVGRGTVARPTLGRYYPWEKPLQEADWTPDQSGQEGEEKSPQFRHPGSKLGPASP